ncbi:Uncharacterised protein [Shigella sonnei]|nr:Uncharacterised protein [Shigella sonnei]
MLFNGQPVRQNLFTQRIQQEGRFTINRSTRYRPHQMPKKPSCHFIGKNDWRFHGGEFTR